MRAYYDKNSKTLNIEEDFNDDEDDLSQLISMAFFPARASQEDDVK